MAPANRPVPARAALLAQYFDDPVVLAGVNEIEDLTTGLSAKIWQKITILNRPA